MLPRPVNALFLLLLACPSPQPVCQFDLDDYCYRRAELCGDLPEGRAPFRTSWWEVRECGEVLEFTDMENRDSLVRYYYGVDSRELIGVSVAAYNECGVTLYGDALADPCPNPPISSAQL